LGAIDQIDFEKSWLPRKCCYEKRNYWLRRDNTRIILLTINLLFQDHKRHLSPSGINSAALSSLSWARWSFPNNALLACWAKGGSCSLQRHLHFRHYIFVTFANPQKFFYILQIFAKNTIKKIDFFFTDFSRSESPLKFCNPFAYSKIIFLRVAFCIYFLFDWLTLRISRMKHLWEKILLI